VRRWTSRVSDDILEYMLHRGRDCDIIDVRFDGSIGESLLPLFSYVVAPCENSELAARIVSIADPCKIDVLGNVIRSCIHFYRLQFLKEMIEGRFLDFSTRNCDELDIVNCVLTPYQVGLQPVKSTDEDRIKHGWDSPNRCAWLSFALKNCEVHVDVSHLDRAVQYRVIEDGLQFFINQGDAVKKSIFFGSTWSRCLRENPTRCWNTTDRRVCGLHLEYIM